MVKDGRFQVSFEVVTEALPPIDEDLICLKLPQKWFPLLQGWLSFIRARFPYAGDEAEANQDKGAKFLELFDGCDVITDLRILNNRLEAQFCGSNLWVLIGKINTIPMRYQNGQMQYDVDGDGTFEVSQYINNVQNIFGTGGLPVTDDNDRFCRAAWAMANSLSDDYADVAKKIDLATNQVASRGIQWLGAIVPWTLSAETIESITEGVSSFIKDWLYGAARDPETIRQVAEILFCSIKDHYPNNLDNVIKDLDLGPYEPIGGPLQSFFFWENFGALAEVAYNTGTGTNTAYLILAYAKVSELAFIEFLGLATPVKDAMIYALNTAEHFDGRECGSFSCMTWEHEFLSTDLITWEIFNFGIKTSSGWVSTCETMSWMIPIKYRTAMTPDLNLPSGLGITYWLNELDVYYSNDADVPVVATYSNGGEGYIEVSRGSVEAGTHIETYDLNIDDEQTSIGMQLRGQEESNPCANPNAILITKFVLRGTGIDPWL